MPMNKTIIANNVKRQRKVKKLSQAQLAEMSNLSTQYVSHIETGKKTISLGAAWRVADALGVSIGTILDNEVNSCSPGNSEIDEIFFFFYMYERQILIEGLRATKKALRENKELLKHAVNLL